MFYVFLSLFFSVSPSLAEPYPASLKLSELPDQARLQVKGPVPLENSEYGSHTIYHMSFENGRARTDGDITNLGSSFNSQVIIRTDIKDYLELKTVSGTFYDSPAEFLQNDVYCLSKKESRFESDHTSYLETAIDYLFFRDCGTGDAAFVIYAVAGIHLRRSTGYSGYTINHFDFQTSGAVAFIK